MNEINNSFWTNIKKYVLIVFYCLIGFCVALFIGFCCVMEFGVNYTDNTTLSEFTQVTKITFPKNTRLEHCVNSSFQDSFYDAKVVIHKPDLSGFLKSVLSAKSGNLTSKIKTSKTDRLSITNSTCTYRWWDPDSIRNFQAIRIERSGKTRDERERMLLIIDLGSSTYATIYINYVGN